jgi:hypothetical protein
MKSWMRYLLAFVVSVHGLIYIVTPLSSLSTTVFAGWKGSSVLLGNAVTGDALKSITTALWLIAGAGIVLAGVSFVLVSRFPHLWRPVAIIATMVGMLSFIIFWDGQTGEFVNQGGIGLVLSAMIFAGALGFSRYVAPSRGIHATNL